MILIGICGKARSGKDSATEYLVEDRGFARYSMADPIRNMLSQIGVFYDTDSEKESPHKALGKSPRQMMQTLGTEWGRDCVDKDIWLKLGQEAVSKAALRSYPGVVIPDIRFQNEANWVKENGTLIQIVRPDNVEVSPHSSEGGVQGSDYVVHNNGSLGDLYRELDNIMEKVSAKEKTLST
jgi:hypothetical protein